MEQLSTALSALSHETTISEGLDAAREQVNRILASDTFRNSESIRRLLRFVADKTFSAEADHLKEYSVGVDALGKPPSYDPRQDAGVRLVASRLRIKLDEYYRREGGADPLIVRMPKGRFKIAWEPQRSPAFPISPAAALVSSEIPVRASGAAETPDAWKWRRLAIGFMVLSLVLITVVLWPLSERSRVLAVSTASARSASELEALWGPFISSRNQVVIAFWNPMFVRFTRKGRPDVLFRTGGHTGDWNDAISSPEFTSLQRSLGNPSAQPTLNFTMRGSLVSIFALSQFFASRRSVISLTRLDELSWQQVADNNLVLVAPSRQIYERQQALPVSPAFVADVAGIRNLQPLKGEPAVYEDSQDPQQSDGEAVELISMLPGPMGRTRVVSFAGNHAPAMIGSVQSFTDPAFARVLAAKLRNASGEIPPYFQIVVKVRYRDDTPTSTSYVVHRVLSLKQNAADE